MLTPVPPADAASEVVNEIEMPDIQRTGQHPSTLDILPDLFGILLDLETGVVLARDFEKHAGSIRLRIASFKALVADVQGIDESTASRLERIRALESNNDKKRQLLIQVCEQMSMTSNDTK